MGTLVVVGQGYVGLPLAMRAVEVGWTVVGLDANESRIKSLQAGESYVEDIPTGQLQAALASGKYFATSYYEDARAFDVAVMTVPTPLRDGNPDLSYIEAASRSLGRFIRPGVTVILESTTYPGTTEELVAPLLEAACGLVAGGDFYLGYSPERIDPGNKRWTFVSTPKVVSGINDRSLSAVKSFYDGLVETTVVVRSPKEAELAKLLENTFRHVNIALVNEIAMFAHDLAIDVGQAINAAATKPFGYMRFDPGPGVGGHCLPIDPSYLSWQVKQRLGQPFRFVELANDINEHMPDYVVRRVVSVLNEAKLAVNGSCILLLGLAYKKNTSDARESPAIRVAQLLEDMGAMVSAVDPHVVELREPGALRRIELDATSVANADLVVVLTDHDDFDFDLVNRKAQRILDCRQVSTLSTAEKL